MAFFSLPFFTVKITEGGVSSFKAWEEECRSQKCNFPLGLMSCSLTDSVIFLLLLCLQVKPQPMRIAGIHTFLMVDVLGMNQRHVCGVPCSKSTLSKMFVGDFTDKKLEKKKHENFSFLPHSSFSCLDSLWCRTCWLPCWRPDYGWLLFLQQNAFPVLILRRWQLYLDSKCAFPQEA